MNKPTRLFDCIDVQLNMGGVEGMLVSKEEGQWRKYSTIEVKDIVDSLSAGLLAMGISSGDGSVEGRDKIALIAKNCPEWVFLDLAVQQIGAVLIPVYPTAHPNDLAFILNDAGVKLAFVNDAKLFQKITSLRSSIPSLQNIYTFEKTEEAAHWREILGLGQQHHFERISTESKKITTEDLFTIIYTSGTTGTPKGVMLSHRNVLSNVMSTLPTFPVYYNTKTLSFLPLNHIFERMVLYVYLFGGASVHYAESLDNLGDNIREIQPRMFTTVPRLLEKVYERIMAKGAQQPPLKKSLFFWALKLGEQYDVQAKGSLVYRTQLALANKLVFSKWRKGLGNNIDCIVTGAAACSVRLIRIFSAAGIPILEGYGQTETSPVISVNQLREGKWMFGSVGPVIDGVEVKMAEDGEILCKGPNVMMGYYKHPELTAETIKEGWLYTGDIGVLADGQFLKITDRKKEIFKTSGGKFVAPQPIENKLTESPLIEQVMVVGAGEKFAGALIVPCFSAVRKWCAEKEIGTDLTNEQIAGNKAVQKHYGELINKMNGHFNHVEQIKKFELLPHEWTIEGGELTPTLKLKRKVIMEKYGDVVKKIFA